MPSEVTVVVCGGYGGIDRRNKGKFFEKGRMRANYDFLFDFYLNLHCHLLIWAFIFYLSHQVMFIRHGFCLINPLLLNFDYSIVIELKIIY